MTYFAREFGLVQLCLEENGHEPSPTHIKEIADQAVAMNAKVAFVQAAFDAKNVERLAEETGCKIVSINPLSYDWYSEMRLIAGAIANE
jgi:zinc transport system substrate-binding protein